MYDMWTGPERVVGMAGLMARPIARENGLEASKLDYRPHRGFDLVWLSKAHLRAHAGRLALPLRRAQRTRKQLKRDNGNGYI